MDKFCIKIYFCAKMWNYENTTGRTCTLRSS